MSNVDFNWIANSVLIVRRNCLNSIRNSKEEDHKMQYIIRAKMADEFLLKLKHLAISQKNVTLMACAFKHLGCYMVHPVSLMYQIQNKFYCIFCAILHEEIIIPYSDEKEIKDGVCFGCHKKTKVLEMETIVNGIPERLNQVKCVQCSLSIGINGITRVATRRNKY